jgi:hypothetical protein
MGPEHSGTYASKPLNAEFSAGTEMREYFFAELIQEEARYLPVSGISSTAA